MGGCSRRFTATRGAGRADSSPQGDITAEATSAAGAAVSFPQADQNGDTCAPASGSSFGLGSTPVACTATDSSTYGFTVTVVDTTPPAIAVPAPVVEATGPAGAAVAFSVSASDLVDGPVAVSCDHESGSVFAFGPTPVTCNATDAHANSSQNAFTVNVVDTTPPAIAVPAPVVEATGPAGAAVAFSVSASDVVDGPVAVSVRS